VRVFAQGTGQALGTAARGDADLVLVHDPEAEEQFIAEVHGIARRQIAWNDPGKHPEAKQAPARRLADWLVPGRDRRVQNRRRAAVPSLRGYTEVKERRMTPRQKMRALIARQGYTMVPGAYDTLTARLVEQAGFEAVYLTGGGYSRANGYPDLGLLTLPENVRFIGLTVEAVGIPVIADADTGYGNAINVIRTVREYEKSGVAAFHIEDQVSPKKCGHYEGKEVISRAEMIGKIRAAVDTRQDPDLVIIARSDARAVEGLEAAIDRVNAYLEAGADVGFVEAPQNIDELQVVAREVRGPALVNVFEGGKTPMLPANELQAMGFRLGIYPSQTHRAAIRAAQRVLAALKEDGDTNRIEADLATFQEREDTVGTADWRVLAAKYLRLGS
jgi:2-methylisocitrate lyase-like PEP mutase family enzyme